MKLKIKKDGLSDYELRGYLEDIIKGLTYTKKEVIEEYGDNIQNQASRKLLRKVNNSFDKLVHGICSDVVDILNESL